MSKIEVAEAAAHFTRCVAAGYPDTADIDNELFCVVHWPGLTAANAPYSSSNAISLIVIDSI